MAHERLSPRQKMIGMMYLVLTAMLALNVSKETVQAFMKVEKGLSQTVINYTEKNKIIYEEFDKIAAENKVKNGPARDKAYEVKEWADNVFNYLQDVKVEMVKRGGKNAKALRGKVIIIDSVVNYDDNNVPSEILIKSTESGKAFVIKSMLDEYRKFLIETLAGRNQTIEEGVRATLNTEPGRDPAGKLEPWENNTFQLLPLVAAITMLSKLQVDVRNAETDVLKFLYEQIEASSYKFNRLVSTVQAPSTYVMEGQDYEAKVFLSAIDTTQAPKVTVGPYKLTGKNPDGTDKYEMVGTDYTTLQLDDAGKGIYKVRAGSPGPRKWMGLITMPSPKGGELSIPFDAEYTVGIENVVVSLTGVNMLYRGIQNPVDVLVPGVPPNKVKVDMTNGTIKEGKVVNPRGGFYSGTYTAEPLPTAPNAQIIVSAEINGKQKQFKPIQYRVKDIPPPVAFFGTVTGEGSMSLGEIKSMQGVRATLVDFDFDLPYTVTRFTIGYWDKGLYIPKSSQTNRLTDEQKNILNSLTRGKKLYIESIYAIGPTKVEQKLAPLVITVN